MPFQRFNTLKPKPEHIDGVLRVLREQELQTPQAIAKRAELSHTQVNCVLDHLEQSNQLVVVRQNASPKVRVGLKQGAEASTRSSHENG